MLNSLMSFEAKWKKNLVSILLTSALLIISIPDGNSAEGSGVPIGRPQPPASVVLPSPVYAAGATSTDLTISWTAVPDSENGGSAITGYSAVAMVGGTPSAATCSVTAPTVSCTLVGMNFSTDYTINVTASNGIGTSNTVSSASFRTPSVTQTVSITGSPGSVAYGATPTQLGATATSGLPITWSTTSSSVCSVSNTGLVQYISSGTCAITATQDGSGSSFAPASSPENITVTSTLTASSSGATGITGTSATLNGVAPFGGRSIQSIFCLSITNSNSTCTAVSGTAVSSASPNIITAGSGSSTSATVSGLISGQSYFYWLEANDGLTTVKSSPVLFQTLIAPTLSKTGPDNGQAGSNFSTTVTATSGSGIYTTWSADVLPAGLALAPSGSTATISGTPTSAGTTNSVITVTDSSNLNASLSITFTISAAPVIVVPSPVIDTTVDTAPPVLTPEERTSLIASAEAAAKKALEDAAALKLLEDAVAKKEAEELALKKAAEDAVKIAEEIAAKKAEADEIARKAAEEEARLGNPPGSTTPVLTPEGGLPTVSLPGSVLIIVDGKQIGSQYKVVDSNKLQISYGSTTLSISIIGPDGLPTLISATQPLKIEISDQIYLEGSGFFPDTKVTIWIFSTPLKLGNLTVDKSGKFAGTVNGPAKIELGPHTIQINGIDETKRAISYAIAALVVEKTTKPIDEAIKEELGSQTGPGFTTPALGKTIFKGVLFTKNSANLITYEKKVIIIYKKLLTKTSQVTCIGFTHSKKPKLSEIAIAKKQATAACKYLLPSKKAKFKIAVKDIKLAKKTGRRTSVTKKYPVNFQITTPKKA